MQKSLFPGYTIGPDAYEDIVNVCPAYGKKVAIIGGKQAPVSYTHLFADRRAGEGSAVHHGHHPHPAGGGEPHHAPDRRALGGGAAGGQDQSGQ